MKFGKRSLILISVFAFLVLVFFINSVHDQKTSERDTLNEKLALTQSKIRGIQIDTLSTRKIELEQELIQSAAQLNATGSALSHSINKTEIVAILLKTAKGHSLEITDMILSGVTSANLSGIPASAVSLTATLEGDIPNLVAFTTQLNSFFSTGAIQSANITGSANITSSTNISSKKPQASIAMTIYQLKAGNNGQP